MIQIQIGTLGTVSGKVVINSLCDTLNSAQGEFKFSAIDGLDILSPGKKKPGNTLYYDPDDLFSEIHQNGLRREIHPRQIQVWITDNEVFEDLFSTVSQSNDVILVSLRTTNLAEILRSTYKTYQQYCELEIGAQLLCLIYRRHTGINGSPSDCDPPWHRDVRNDLFDYYGLKPDNVTKLMSPRLDEISRAKFREANVPSSIVDACLAIVHQASKHSAAQHFRRKIEDPFIALLVGAAIGFLTSAASVLKPNDWYLFWIPLTSLLVVRLYLLRRQDMQKYDEG